VHSSGRQWAAVGVRVARHWLMSQHCVLLPAVPVAPPAAAASSSGGGGGGMMTLNSRAGFYTHKSPSMQAGRRRAARGRGRACHTYRGLCAGRSFRPRAPPPRPQPSPDAPPAPPCPIAVARVAAAREAAGRAVQASPAGGRRLDVQGGAGRCSGPAARPGPYAHPHSALPSCGRYTSPLPAVCLPPTVSPERVCACGPGGAARRAQAGLGGRRGGLPARRACRRQRGGGARARRSGGA
jgi:hypothetical protein